MTKLRPLSAAALAILALAACKPKQPQVIDTNPDPMANVLANAPPVELPPAIKANVTMRCKEDNSLVYLEFLQGDKQLRVRTQENGPAQELNAPNAGEAFTNAAGYSVKGDESRVTFKQPGKGALTCHT